MKKIILALLVIVLSGCVTLYDPIPPNYTGGVAVITDTVSNKANTKADYFMLTKIDDQPIENSWSETRSANYGRGMSFNPVMLSRQVLPKNQTFTIVGMVFFPTDFQSIIGDEMKVEKNITFTPKIGMTYYVKGELSKDNSKVWLEDSAGNIIP